MGRSATDCSNPDGEQSPVPRAAIYTRVSTAGQVTGTSLSTQLDRCTTYAQTRGWSVVEVFTDEGVSAVAATRPCLDQLGAAIDRGAIDVVIVAALDRLGRSTRDLSRLLADWDRHGVRLVSVTESFDSTTTDGRLVRNLLSTIAEFERNTIAERTRTGIHAASLAGRWPGGPPPFGYQLHPTDGRLLINPTEAAVIRRAWQLLAVDHHSPAAAAQILNHEHLAPRNAARWTGYNLSRLLTAATLHLDGTWTYHPPPRPGSEPTTVDIAIPPILTTAENQQLHHALTSHRRRRSPRRQYLLSGRLTSPHGTPMHGVYRNDHHTSVYRCTDTSKRRDARCSCRRTNTSVVDAIVWNTLAAVLADPNRLTTALDAAHEHALDADTPETTAIARHQGQIAKLEAAHHTLNDYALHDPCNPAAVAHAKQIINRHLTAARRALHRARSKHASTVNERVQQLTELAHTAASIHDTNDITTRRRVLELLEVRAQITDWQPCPTCTTRPSSRCADCHGHGHQPQIVVTSPLPLHLHFTTAPVR